MVSHCSKRICVSLFTTKLAEGDAATDTNTLVFKMDVTGEAPPAAEDGAPLRRFHHVYSSDFQWVPQGEQEDRYASKAPAPVHSDILLAKLQPGQRIAVEMHAVKGVGKDHAKFSPVATASYRLLPAVKLLQPVYDEDAQELAARSKVFDAVPCTDGSGHKLMAKVARPRLCNMSREIIRDPKFADKVHISRVADHFICKCSSHVPAAIFTRQISLCLANSQFPLRQQAH